MKFILPLVLSFCLLPEVNGQNTNMSNSNIQDSTNILKSPAVKTEAVSKDSKKKSAALDQNVQNKLIQYATEFTKIEKTINYQNFQKNPTKEQQQKLDEIVAYYKENKIFSFEFNYYAYVAGNHNVNLASNLFEAKRYAPKNVDVHVQLAAYNFITRNEGVLKDNLKLIYQNGKIEPELLRYAKDLLKGIPENATLILHGFDDMYSLIYVQKIENFRSDVKLISLDFLQSKHHRKLLGDENYKFPKSDLINVEFVKAFCELNQNKNLFLSLTLPKNYFEPLMEDLSIVGLCLKYGESDKNYLKENLTFWNNTKNSANAFVYHSEKVKKISSNYLPILLLLEKEFKASNDTKEEQEIARVIKKISEQAKKTP